MKRRFSSVARRRGFFYELHHAIQLAQEQGYASAAEDGEEGDRAMGIA